MAGTQTTFVPLWDRMEGAWLWTQDLIGSPFVGRGQPSEHVSVAQGVIKLSALRLRSEKMDTVMDEGTVNNP